MFVEEFPKFLKLINYLFIRIFSVETNHVGQIFEGRPVNIRNLLKRNGYAFHSTQTIDDIFVKKDLLRDEL